jgi:major curlin subunit
MLGSIILHKTNKANVVNYRQRFNPINQPANQPSAKEVTTMTTINTIKATVKSATLLKTGLLGLVAAAGIGLISLPVKADEINQNAVQTSIQEGTNNTAINQSTQNAQIRDFQSRFGRAAGYLERSGTDVINQNADQLNKQFGVGNTAVNQSNQDAKVRRDRTFFGR